VKPGHSTALLGSSVSNRHTAQVLGLPEDPRFHTHGPGFRADFQYSIHSIKDQWVARLQDGNSDWRVPNNAIVDRNGRLVAVPEYDEHGRLRTDFLLVTRHPQQLGGASQLIFSPTHGPGLRAVDLLLFHLPQQDLELLEKKMEDETFFQAIFEIGDLYEEAGTTLPGSIRLMRRDTVSPVPVKVTLT
jgi:hypothetical protein